MRMVAGKTYPGLGYPSRIRQDAEKVVPEQHADEHVERAYEHDQVD